MSASVHAFGATFLKFPVAGAKETSLDTTFELALGGGNNTKYINRVWDSVKGDNHFWISSASPDFFGAYYTGPGTWGVDTSYYAVFSV